MLYSRFSLQGLIGVGLKIQCKSFDWDLASFWFYLCPVHFVFIWGQGITGHMQCGALEFRGHTEFMTQSLHAVRFRAITRLIAVGIAMGVHDSP